MAALVGRYVRNCGFLSISKRLLNTSSVQTQYKSPYSLDKVYPNSNQDATAMPKVPQNTDGHFSGYIPIDKLDITYSRSSGPGGQRVNKLNTKVDVRFHLPSAEWLTEDMRQTLLYKFQNKLTKEGYYVIQSDKTRTRHMNLADAMNRLREAIWKGLKRPDEPDPLTEEQIRRRLERAARERLKDKRIQSMKRESRRAPTLDI